ncbi:MAG TPA: hypothetical protein VFE53_09255 [Mucilaginibacter sp.]|jgi:hypothetical protein|nr:hypothetical protein [Mucilaginibacter sp.]
MGPLVLITDRTFAQDAKFFKPDSVRRQIKAVKISAMLKTDGVPDEPERGLAGPSAEFVQIEPYQGKAPAFATIVKVLYNQQYLT